MEPPLPKKPKLEENEAEDIGGKEMKFEYWEMLPCEIRCMIAKETDVMTRFSLMFSSKSNYRIARSVPIKIESIAVGNGIGVELPEIDPEKRNICIQLKKYDPSEVITSLFFVEDGDGTIIHRYWERSDLENYATASLSSNLCYYEASMLFIENLLQLTDYQVDEFSSGVNDWGYDVVFLDKLRINKELSIFTSDGDTFNRWMNTVNSPLEKLKIHIPSEGFDPYRTDDFHLNHMTIVNSKKLELLNGSDSLVRVDLFGLKCNEFCIYGPEVAPQAVNQFVKKWISGNGPENFRRGMFMTLEFGHDEGNIEISLDGLNYILWRDEFRVDNKLLSECVTFDKSHCYYIETKKRDNGAALVFESYGAVFLVAGKQKST